MKKLSFLILLSIVFSLTTFGQSDPKDEKQVMKPALLVIDVQNQYMPMMSQSDLEAAIQRINWAVWLFKEHDLPVINIHHTTPDHGPEPGTEAFAFDERITVAEDDPKVTKTYGSSFTQTDLDDILKEKDVNTLFMCGLSSVGCVLATYFDGANYDYTSFLIKDAMLSHDADYTNQVENMFDALDLHTISFMLEIRR
jgi:nicotinamidase-related amidase